MPLDCYGIIPIIARVTMSRPRKARTLESLPAPVIYIPAGWTQHQSTPVEVAIEDFEIMRLTDGRGVDVAIGQAATMATGPKMGISGSPAQG